MCIFCNIKEEDVIYKNDHMLVIYDRFPVTKGHSLIITKRHVSNYFELNADEKASIDDAILWTKELLDRLYKPDGYNIGINNGTAAGQTIMHLHVHIIPRYIGDVENPRGGVRGVIPSKQSY